MHTQPTGETDRVYLLTGVTGFLGKVLLEALMRRHEELGVQRVYVLVRPQGPLSAEERFRRAVVSSPCFSRLPRGWAGRVEVVAGTLEQAGLDLDPSARCKITGRVTHVLHAAGSVDFGLTLAQAARSNVSASLNLLELARACSRLQKLVSISTAYVTPHRGDGTLIEEALAPLPGPAEDIYRLILDGGADDGELLARFGHPNTYTLTKSLAEHLLVARGGAVPLAIVRPSIISASWRHPFPGWI